MRSLVLCFASVFVIVERPKPLRQGNVAYRNGDYEFAEQRYADALETSTNPGLVAYNRGLALARQGEYRAAETDFRASLSDATAPTSRQAACHYNLGLCLLLRANFEGGSFNLTTEAIREFERTLSLLNDKEPLRKDALHNLEVAKLLWIEARNQALQQPPQQEQAAIPERNNDFQPPTFEELEPTPQPGNGSPRSAQPGGDVAGQQRMDPIETDQQSPGAGTLPVLADSDEPQPLNPADARLHLQRVAQRLRAERQANAAVEGERTFPHVRDW